ncbi:phosphoglycolate phosphatase [Falseniella ignava]|uniref:Phosphoglycolate phosphatase n=1 Tax=Falseniella ignava TaxID=137730 RepID=A0A2I1JYZ4_9LACT|nr:HAD family hydrolase [Falseniella ignava]PKY88573.1 phosphoglycolate phosphatase [Falseniella ignava]
MQYYLFDLDGTLVDPGVGITSGVQYTLKHFGIEVEDRRQLYPFIGPPLLDSFMDFFNLNEMQAKEAIDYYREYYGATGLFENTVYPGIKTVLDQLKSQGKMIALATSKPEVFAERILAHYKLTDYFDYIGGATFDGVRSHKLDVIRYVLQVLGNPASDQVVMVGDRKFDVLAGNELSLTTVGVLYGYGSQAELQAAKADYIISQPTDLLQIFDQ